MKEDVEKGLQQLFSVDEEISETFQQLAENPFLVSQAASTVSRAIIEKKKIFLYGCGATGRLAKQIESAVWRPFWNRIKKSRTWERLEAVLPDDIEDLLIGEMTGGDRALVSSLEGFEDLQIVGRLQLKDRGIKKGDVVFCITEGGETSSVIGAILAALGQYGKLSEKKTLEARNDLYFLYNNPDGVLKPYERSRSVIDNPAITKINLTTGPQAITGSTRMQATTSETFLMGIILEAGIFGVLKEHLPEKDLEELGFPGSFLIKDRLRSFDEILKALKASVKGLSRFTHLESETYRHNRFTTYFADKASATVFTDCTERSPTFHLHPLDNTRVRKRKCWLQVWIPGEDRKSAWRNLLGRDFRGLAESFYKAPFQEKIADGFLRKAAIESLSQAGNDQENRYDFSFSPDNISRRDPHQGDLGVLVCIDEEGEDLSRTDSGFFRFASLVQEKGASLALILVADRDTREIAHFAHQLPFDNEKDIVIPISIKKSRDPLNLDRQILLKMLLNAHSTAVMARMGKVVGNTMTNVKPSNLKLIGRATYLIMSHVNDVISQEEWSRNWGKSDLLTYDQANAVLFDAMDFVGEENLEVSEVELSIIRILEALRTKKNVGWRKILALAESVGLEEYLEKHNPGLKHTDKG